MSRTSSADGRVVGLFGDLCSVNLSSGLECGNRGRRDSFLCLEVCESNWGFEKGVQRLELMPSIYSAGRVSTRGVILEYAGRTHVRGAYVVTLGVIWRHGLRLLAS